LNTAQAVREKVADLSRFFPPGVRVDYPLDTSTFVRISIEEVLKTLLEAIALVFLVMYLFLQNIRATLIPTIVVPVALLGTFASMLAFGFSINVLTLFGMVLAIAFWSMTPLSSLKTWNASCRRKDFRHSKRRARR